MLAILHYNQSIGTQSAHRGGDGPYVSMKGHGDNVEVNTASGPNTC